MQQAFHVGDSCFSYPGTERTVRISGKGFTTYGGSARGRVCTHDDGPGIASRAVYAKLHPVTVGRVGRVAILHRGLRSACIHGRPFSHIYYSICNGFTPRGGVKHYTCNILYPVYYRSSLNDLVATLACVFTAIAVDPTTTYNRSIVIPLYVRFVYIMLLVD